MQSVKVDYNKEFSETNGGFVNSMVRMLENGHIMSKLNPSKDDSILEIGCNSGQFTKKLLKHCNKVIGIDINEEAINTSDLNNLFCMNAEELDFKNESFSKIVSMHTIEHIPNIKKAILEMGRVVKKGGRIVLSYPFEPVRGITCLRTACVVYKNPMMCRQLHLHKLNRGKMEEIIKDTQLMIASHKIIFNPWPVYVTVLEKAS
ncbi:hypothetical protein CMO88_01850 [Candidatus Woesearchaeota archaeon]|nr:hypothetical protein [Candidatus Woesearchaeota archaeon]|tara:strand:- start:4976 stop:5587 length:612 start_codon:yes stop_codon:yes gene_type:complete